MKKEILKKIFQSITYLYMFLPILLFFLGWMKLSIALPICMIICYALYRLLQRDTELWIPDFDRDTLLKILPIITVIALWVYLSGIGGMVFQNHDHVCRNAVFDLLVTEDWPVVMDLSINGAVTERAMVYYIGFWLPAAVIGKLFGLTAGYLFQAIWAIFGIAIFYYMICEYFQKISIWPLIGLIFFSGLDFLGCQLLQVPFDSLTPFMHLEWWAGYFQYSSFTTQLFWVFNQAIYAWILMMLIMRQTDNGSIVLFWSCGLLECTLPFVGMLPFVIYKIFKNGFSLKKIFTFENAVAGGCIGILTFLYEISNISATSTSGSAIHYGKGYIFLYIVFLLVEVGFYAAIIYPYQKYHSLYWLCLIILILCPLIHVGSGQDFGMRASIPALLILMLMTFESWQKSYNDKNRIVFAGITIFFLIGSVTSFGEINRTTKETAQLYAMNQSIMAESVSVEEIMGAPNFSGNVTDSFFFQYLAR